MTKCPGYDCYKERAVNYAISDVLISLFNVRATIVIKSQETKQLTYCQIYNQFFHSKNLLT
jgi:hypothetical protein